MRGLRSAQCNVVINLCCSGAQPVLAQAAEHAQAKDSHRKRQHHKRIRNTQSDEPAAHLCVLARKHRAIDRDRRLFRAIPTCPSWDVLKRLRLLSVIEQLSKIHFDRSGVAGDRPQSQDAAESEYRDPESHSRGPKINQHEVGCIPFRGVRQPSRVMGQKASKGFETEQTAGIPACFACYNF